MYVVNMGTFVIQGLYIFLLAKQCSLDIIFSCLSFQLSSSLPGAEWEAVLLHRRVSAAPRHTVWARSSGGCWQGPQSHPAVAQTPQRLLQQGGSESLLQQPPNLLAGVNRSHQVRTGKQSRGYIKISVLIHLCPFTSKLLRKFCTVLFQTVINCCPVSWLHLTSQPGRPVLLFHLYLVATHPHSHCPVCCFANSTVVGLCSRPLAFSLSAAHRLLCLCFQPRRSSRHTRGITECLQEAGQWHLPGGSGGNCLLLLEERPLNIPLNFAEL